MERLTERELSVLGNVGYNKCYNTLCTLNCGNCEVQEEVSLKLKEYEDAEEQGLLLRLPCKVGDTLYQPIGDHINEYKVLGLCFDIFLNKWKYEVAYEIEGVWKGTICDFDVIGKTVFLTKEEAEQKLAEYKGGMR